MSDDTYWIYCQSCNLSFTTTITPIWKWPIFMCFTIKYRLNREYSSPANRTLKTNLDRPSKNSTGLMSRGTSKELVFGLSYLKAPLPIDPLAVILCLNEIRSFRIFGQGQSSTNGYQKPWQNKFYCWQQAPESPWDMLKAPLPHLGITRVEDTQVRPEKRSFNLFRLH